MKYYDVYANTDDKAMGYWFTSLRFDTDVLEFTETEIGELWTEPTLLVDINIINEGNS